MENSKTQSFAASVKDEIVSFSREEENERALLSSFVKMNGHIHRLEGRDILECHSEKASIAKYIYQCIHELYGVSVRFAYTRSAGFLKRMNYLVIVEEKVDEILEDLGIDVLLSKSPRIASAQEEQIASFLAGAFLAAGSVNDPKSTSYHLEIALLDESYARWLSKLMNRIHASPFHSKVTKRRNEYIVYLKRSDEISNFLILVGAKESCLHYENVRIDRDFANQTNRLSNLDSANMGKTLKAGERQVKEILFLKKKGAAIAKIHNPKLEHLCSLRLLHEDASLSELSEYLSEELASKISKSNVNHLFRFIHELYLKESQK